MTAKGCCFGPSPAFDDQPQLSRINWHDALDNVLICRAFKKSSERLVTVFQTTESCICVRWSEEKQTCLSPHTDR
jgi:hypothetical protein